MLRGWENLRDADCKRLELAQATGRLRPSGKSGGATQKARGIGSAISTQPSGGGGGKSLTHCGILA
jgi:hypothetical protein